MKNKILHISRDEKFIDSAIFQFNSLVNVENTFCVLSQTNQLKHIKSIEAVQVCPTVNDIISVLYQYDIVIIHSLEEAFIPAILKLKKQQELIWMCFGFEVYNDSFYYNKLNLYGPLTQKETFFVPFSLKKKLKNYIRPYYRLINKRLPYTTHELKIQAIKRVNYLVSSYKEEYDAISKYTRSNKKQFSFAYYPLEQITNINDLNIVVEKQILIGNSGTLTNNHFDVFNTLSKLDLEDFSILSPLSYGDENYIERVAKKGTQMFGEHFNSLQEFLPLNLYNLEIKKSGIAVFYNFRQQAIGNTIASLWFGAKVFLNENNSFYKFLKRINIIVFDFDKDFNQDQINNLLTEQEIAHNRTLLKQYFSKNILINALQKDVNNLLK